MRRPARRSARTRRERSRRGPPARRPSTSRGGARPSTLSPARSPQRAPRSPPPLRGGRVPEALDQLFLEFQTAIAGRYSLERELGRGGMGVVYLARGGGPARLIALKLLAPPPGRGAAPRARL